MRNPRWKAWLPALLLPLALFVLGACASGPVTLQSIDTNSSCRVLSNQLDKAQNDLTVAENKAKDDAGTPAVQDDQKAQQTAKASIDKLTNAIKAKKCGDSSSASSSAAATSSSASCSTWAIKADPHQDENFITGGLKSIKDAHTDDQAKAAALDWLDKMKSDVGNLAFTIQTVLHENVPVDQLQSNGCATTQAANYETQMVDTIKGSTVTTGQAPASGTNTGSQSDVGVASSQSGVTGDRTAVIITQPDGSSYSVMARCGNVVFPTAAPPTVPRTSTPPPSHHTTPPSHYTVPPTPTTPPAPPTHHTPPPCTHKCSSESPPPPPAGGPGASGTTTIPSRSSQPTSQPTMAGPTPTEVSGGGPTADPPASNAPTYTAPPTGDPGSGGNPPPGF